ncbi:RNA polymerase sigma factor [Thalassoroseus pseudoceratinae]|uniref:RNA polymerase sigma factor n=1 Tax=Thalassoroseus pseudoceratinae TaxID=2713176 RepID=UPI001420BD5D|nr:sigma-70 family RNA polymerase sigma factor [Thalassoroseus pseudoceratinae]
MSTPTNSRIGSDLIASIREGSSEAWSELIGRYEGRLLAFAVSRLGDRSSAEDVVQEAFLGFLVSLPNYDETTPIESWLFTITAHKLTDHLRREGRRPTIPLAPAGLSQDMPGQQRHASSIMRSHERRRSEETVLANALRDLIASWQSGGQYERLMCIELLFVAGLSNQATAARLGISEQAVANHKSYVVRKLKEVAQSHRLSDLFS